MSPELKQKLNDAMLSIRNRQDELLNDSISDTIAYEKGKKLMLRYLNTFFRNINNNVPFPWFISKEDYCGICMMLDPYNPHQAQILPYMLTAYLYNILHTRVNDSFLNVLKNNLNAKQKRFFFKHSVLWGQDLTEYSEYIPDTLFNNENLGIGGLFHPDQANDATEKTIRKSVNYFRFYTEEDFPTYRGSSCEPLFMYRQSGTGYMDDPICPMCYAKIVKVHNATRSSRKGCYPNIYSESMLTHHKLYYSSTIITAVAQEWCTAIDSIQKRPPSAPPIDYEINNQLFSWLKTPLNPKLKDKKPRGSQPRKPKQFIPEDSISTTWPVTVDLRLLGHEYSNCTVIPVFSSDDNVHTYMSAQQSKFAPSTPPLIEIGGYANMPTFYFKRIPTKPLSDFKSTKPVSKRTQFLLDMKLEDPQFDIMAQIHLHHSHLYKRTPEEPYAYTFSHPRTDWYALDDIIEFMSQSLSNDTADNLQISESEQSPTTTTTFYVPPSLSTEFQILNLPKLAVVNNLPAITLYFFFDLPPTALQEISDYLDLPNHQGPSVSLEIHKEGFLTIIFEYPNFGFVDVDSND